MSYAYHDANGRPLRGPCAIPGCPYLSLAGTLWCPLHRLDGLCPCGAMRHGPDGCPNEAVPNPEDHSELIVCGLCAPWESTGLHGDEFAGRLNPYNPVAGYSRDDIDATLADRELMQSEFPGWSEAELAELFGK
jgi:hypothetical protein